MDGNTEQVRRAVEQVAEQVLERYEQKHPSSPFEGVLRWLPMLIAAGSLLYTFAVVQQQVAQNRRDLDRLQVRIDQSSTVMQSVDSRLARIETTLDIITGGRKEPSNVSR